MVKKAYYGITLIIAIGLCFALVCFPILKYNKDSVPIELLYLVRIYRINVKKINYHKFLILYSLINSFIISTVYIIVSYLVKKIFIQLIVGAVLLILLIIICYGLLGRYYLKKEGKKYEWL